jgi:hypothetical protein
MSKPRLIAFYLPQFYPTKENDEWWQKGFTEWTNVGNAKPLFKGHYQPRVPADLGYYDLRVPEVREEQAKLAREAGIEGFCYWHYWFAGRRLLDRVFREVVESGKPDYPFCLCWANHSWYQKTWDPTKPDKLLIEQTYPGEQDFIDHFNAMLPAFKDQRYMKVNGKLLFGFFSPKGISKEQFLLFSSIWNEMANQNGLEGFDFFGFTYNTKAYEEIIEMGFNHVSIDYIIDMHKSNNVINDVIRRGCGRILRYPDKVYDYQRYIDYVGKQLDTSMLNYPCLLPNFDHSPRSGNRAYILHNSTPQKWEKLCDLTFSQFSIRPHEQNVIFLKAWNEWGEGNYLEPDLKYGKGYLNALKSALDKCKI